MNVESFELNCHGFYYARDTVQMAIAWLAGSSYNITQFAVLVTRPFSVL
ncbi:hypothetical protein GQ600_24366 [Phytophthora cactorum]|nr:hypothetical protein GQ600_24366 [Phytophthora cactorum]